MKNIFEVIRQKETELQQIQKDLELLRGAARLLADDNESEQIKPAAVPRPAATASAAGSNSRENVLRQFP